MIEYGTLNLCLAVEGGLLLASDKRMTVMPLGVCWDNARKITPLGTHDLALSTGLSLTPRLMELIPLWWETQLAGEMFEKWRTDQGSKLDFDLMDPQKALSAFQPAFDEKLRNCVNGIAVAVLKGGKEVDGPILLSTLTLASTRGKQIFVSTIRGYWAETQIVSQITPRMQTPSTSEGFNSAVGSSDGLSRQRSIYPKKQNLCFEGQGDVVAAILEQQSLGWESKEVAAISGLMLPHTTPTVEQGLHVLDLIFSLSQTYLKSPTGGLLSPVSRVYDAYLMTKAGTPQIWLDRDTAI